MAGAQLTAKELDNFENTLAATRTLQNERPFRAWGLDPNQSQSWVDTYRASKEAKPEEKRRVFTAVRGLDFPYSSPSAKLALLELDGGKDLKPMQRLLAYQAVTLEATDDTTSWDRISAYAQAASEFLA